MRNPLIERELVGGLRTQRAVAMQVLPAFVCAALVLLRWPAEGQADIGGVRAREVFRLFGYGLFTAIVLLVPAFPATAFVRERVQGTLALLLQTPLRPRAIYLGKLAGVLGFACLPLLASLPAAAACYAMGGISARDQVLALYVVLAVMTLQYTALGLFVSLNAATPESALRTTYGLILVLAVMTLGPYQIVQGQGPGLTLTAAIWLRSLSPLPAVMEVLGQSDIGGQGLVATAGYVLRFVTAAILGTVCLAVLTVARLRPTMFDRPRPQGTVTNDQALGTRALRRFLFIIDPNKRSRPIGRFTNPVLVKELRTRRFGRSHWMLRLISACAIASLGLSLVSSAAALDWGTGTVSGLIVLLQGSLILLLTPGLAAGLISGEVESGGWTLLRMTPLSPGCIIRGKLLSVASTLTLILLATTPGYAVLVYAQPTLLSPVIEVFFSLGLTALFALALSAAVGSLFRRTAPATVTAYAVLLAICVGPLLIWLGRDTTFGHTIVERVLLLSPVAAALTIMDVPGFSPYRLVPTSWWITGGAIAVSLLVLRVKVWQLTRPQ